MKLNVIFVLRKINSSKLQGVQLYIIDIKFSGNPGVKASPVNIFNQFLIASAIS